RPDPTEAAHGQRIGRGEPRLLQLGLHAPGITQPVRQVEAPVVVGTANATHRVFHPRATDGLLQLCVEPAHLTHHWLLEAPATGGQRRVPAFVPEASVSEGRGRDAFSGRSGELYQSTTSAHSRRTHDEP